MSSSTHKTRSERLKQMHQIVRAAIDEKKAQRSTIPSDLNALAKSQVLAPDEDMLKQLSDYSQSLREEVSEIYKRSSSTLNEVNKLKNKKENIERVIDCVTSILELKRIASNIGSSHDEIFSNIKTYYNIRDKAVFCSRLLGKIDEDIKLTKEKYKELFDKEAKMTNSDNLAAYSKILNLIMDKEESAEAGSSLDKLVALYGETLKKEYMTVEEALFRIPIVAGTIEKDYKDIFFELVNNCLKLFVSNLKISKTNIFKLYGDDGVEKLVLDLINTNLNPILAEIFKRMRKYFELDKIPLSTKNPILKEKDLLRVEHFSSEYRGTCNQIQRFILYVKQNSVSKQYPKISAFEHDLIQSINSQTMLQMNNCLISYFQAYLRHKLNNLIKKSPFVTSVWQLEVEFFRMVEHQPNLSELAVMHEYLDEMFSIFKMAVESSLQTLNIMIVSSVINFLSNHLIYEDSFYAFNEIFRKFHPRLTLTPTIFQSAIILVLNALYFFPSNFKQLDFKLPQELPQQRIRVELEQLQNLNSQKAKELLREYLGEICQLPYISAQLDMNYKDVLKGWDRLHKDVWDILVEELSQVHANKIKESVERRKMDNLSVLALEKEVRAIIAYYQSISKTTLLDKFKTVLLACSALMLDNEEELTKMLKDANITPDEHQQIRDIFHAKKLKH